MQNALELRKEGLTYENLSEKQKKAAHKGAWHIKVTIAMGMSVGACFLTGCIPGLSIAVMVFFRSALPLMLR